VGVDAERHQHAQANVDGLRRFEAHCQLPLYDVEKEVQTLVTNCSCFGVTVGSLSTELVLGLGVSWRRGVVVSGVRRMNDVNPRRARLLPGWVTVFGRVYYLGL